MSPTQGGPLAVFLAALTAFSPLAAVAQAPPPPKGAKPRLAVIDVNPGEGLVGLAAKITKDLAAAAAKEGTYQVLDPAKVRAAVGSEGMKALLGCKGDPGCLSQKGVVLQDARIVTGDLQKDAEHYMVKLWLIDVKSGAIVSSVDRKILIASRRLDRDVAEAIPSLIRGEAEAVGTARITTENGLAGAKVLVDGVEVGETPFEHKAKPGRYTLKLEHPDYYPAERFFTVSAGETAEVVVAIAPLPKAAEPPPMIAKAPEESGQSALAPALMIGGGALVVTGAILMVLASGKAGEIQESSVDGNGIQSITRAEALASRDAASSATTLLVVGGLLAGVGAIAGTVGVIQW